jgi:hypothetical protein
MTHPSNESNVVFPEPEGPTINVTSPLLNAVVEGANATIVVSPVLYSLPAPSILAATSIFIELLGHKYNTFLYYYQFINDFFCMTT